MRVANPSIRAKGGFNSRPASRSSAMKVPQAVTSACSPLRSTENPKAICGFSMPCVAAE